MRGIHGHSCSNQARRKKARKAAGQTTTSIGWSSECCKSLRAFRRTRSWRGEEAHFIGCWQSGDFEGFKETVGKGQGAGEKSRSVAGAKKGRREHRFLGSLGSKACPATKIPQTYRKSRRSTGYDGARPATSILTTQQPLQRSVEV